MTTITIRNVTPDVRNELASRAARRGMSLQEFMLTEVTRLAERPPVADVLAGARTRAQELDIAVSRAEILADVTADRR